MEENQIPLGVGNPKGNLYYILKNKTDFLGKNIRYLSIWSHFTIWFYIIVSTSIIGIMGYLIEKFYTVIPQNIPLYPKHGTFIVQNKNDLFSLIIIALTFFIISITIYYKTYYKIKHIAFFIIIINLIINIFLMILLYKLIQLSV